MGIYKHREKVKKNNYNTKPESKVVRNYRGREVQFAGTRERAGCARFPARTSFRTLHIHRKN